MSRARTDLLPHGWGTEAGTRGKARLYRLEGAPPLGGPCLPVILPPMDLLSPKAMTTVRRILAIDIERLLHRQGDFTVWQADKF